MSKHSHLEIVRLKHALLYVALHSTITQLIPTTLSHARPYFVTHVISASNRTPMLMQHKPAIRIGAWSE